MKLCVSDLYPPAFFLRKHLYLGCNLVGRVLKAGGPRAWASFEAVLSEWWLGRWSAGVRGHWQMGLGTLSVVKQFARAYIAEGVGYG